MSMPRTGSEFRAGPWPSLDSLEDYGQNLEPANQEEDPEMAISKAKSVAKKRMRQDERLDAITEQVMNQGSIRIEDLAEQFGVSFMTIHRDLDVLDDKGLLRKSRGQVTAVATSLFEASTEYRVRQGRSDKIAIAHAAFELVEPGQAVMLDDSTTGLHLAKLLLEKQPLTVISNFTRVIDALKGHPGIALISPGGQYYHWNESTMGSVTLNGLRSLRADILFMSSPAVTNGVCYHQHHDAVLVKQAMFESSNKRVLYLDHTKFTNRALHAHLKISDFDVVIVDSHTRPEHIAQVQESGAQLIVAPPLLTSK